MTTYLYLAMRKSFLLSMMNGLSSCSPCGLFCKEGKKSMSDLFIKRFDLR